ncbi:MAG: biotin--[acetyl-CoA-carboxylase] ligase [Butyrivibrio sp.]|jgi:BirA family biotin operon repressor/biotin-[acetyl-CoA-carboxylase] ligase|uniref:biotin--[acetyl-CoA-carboxylase] ligase n=1 Tax=Butyrivibrio sp. TaxID=28121 RepID=UPI001EC9147A|nr:biotin--[acetyl-CoA-carboxylase] ligase [Butyrivibrio sp.]MBE5841383.1 biotin--[acetyl-CoA-carboxylase] ligase [Butyrivibrio sp.]
MNSKDKVLEILNSNKDRYISGESIASLLGISRNAIWKAINELRKSGYEIEAVSNKGYRLALEKDILSAGGILSYLNEDVAAIYQDGSNMIHIFDTTTSTNRIAKELAIAGNCHGTLVVSARQTSGKGRRDHSFFSPEGGLYFSVILSPDRISYKTPDEITTFIGNSVCDAIENTCSIRPRLKPINDLFIGDKKVCGILTEAGTEFETGLVQWIVVGIGINFDSDIDSFPDDIKDKAISLFEPGKATITKNQLVAAIVNKII